MELFPCPCCGYLVFSEWPGSYNICPICRWEDDRSQLRWVRSLGANHVSLIEAQRNFAQDGAKYGPKDKRYLNLYAEPSEYHREPDWRPVDESIDNIEENDSVVVGTTPLPTTEGWTPFPEDLTTLYYWRPTYWRRAKT